MSYDYKILPKNNTIFLEREEGITHTPFTLEYRIFDAIRKGAPRELNQAIKEYLEYGFCMGNMSNNPIHQVRYWAVSTISIAIHYAILGGLDETDAYNYSDLYIMKIDTLNGFDEILSYLMDKAIELANLVQNCKTKDYSPFIQKTIHYIHIHLHEKLKTIDIAESLGISRDYLATLFKKETGIPIHSFILKEKIEESKKLIIENHTFKDIAYILSFSSQTHYIKAFKQYTKMTPQQWKSMQK